MEHDPLFEFNVIESDPDSLSDEDITTSEENSTEDLNEPIMGSKSKVKSKTICKPFNTKSDLISETKKFQERLQKINQVKFGCKEFYQVLDKSYLRLFFGSVLAYFFVGLIICGIYLGCIYIFNEPLWYTYFPSTEYCVKEAAKKDEL